ncbi:hypothetical protein C3L33_05266, partial [Rhododendron williamsianum]
MAFSTSNPLQRQTQLYFNTLCKSPWIFNNSFKFHFPSPSPLTLSPPKHPPPLQRRFSPLLTLRTPCARIDTTLTEKHQEIPRETSNDSNNVATSSGFSQSSANGKRVGGKTRRKSVSSVEVENPELTGATRDGDTVKRLDSSEKKGIYFEFSNLFLESIRKYFEKNLTGSNGESNGKIEKGFGKQLGVNRRKKADKKGKGKKGKGNPPEVMLKLGLDRVGGKTRRKSVSSVEVENPELTGATRDGDTVKRLDSSEKKGIYFEFSNLFLESIRKYFEKNLTGSNGESNGKIEKGFGKQLGVNRRKKADKKGKGKKGKGNPPEVMLKLGLDRCSKMGDVLGALILYDLARREGVRMDQSHYTILLYLCSSAATGGVQTAKSGSGGRSSSTLDPIGKVSTSDTEVSGKFVASLDQWIDSGAMEMDYIWVLTEVGNENYDILFRLKEIGMVYNGKSNPQVKDGRNDIGIGDSESGDIKDGDNTKKLDIGASSTMIKEYALLRGFEICNRMCCNEVPMNEASFTSVARLCMALGDGDMAFFIVKQMKPRGVNPRLRSYDPALSAFCNSGDVDKAFSVEQHMLEHGVYPEEPELGALLKVNAVVNGVHPLLPSKKWPLIVFYHRRLTGYQLDKPVCMELIDKWKTVDALYATPTGSNDDW